MPQSLLSFSDLYVRALLLFIPLFILLLKRRGSFNNKTHLPPSPPKLPIIGNLHQLGFLPHRSLRTLSEKHGPLMLLSLGQSPTLIVSSTHAARDIMGINDIIFASRPDSKVARLLLSGTSDLAFAPYGDYWRKARKLCVTHLLSTKMVQSFRIVRKEEVAFMIEKISSGVINMVDMSEVLNSFSNDIICRAVAGKFFRREGRQNVMVHKLAEENSALLGGFHVEDYLPWLAWLDVFFGLNVRAKRNAEKWNYVLDKVIEDHANRYEEAEDTDFVDVLLSLQKDPNSDLALGKEHIKALLQDMFAAGTDTTYILLEWAMAELVRSPGAMKKLQDEVREVASREAGVVREEELIEMRYLKAVLKETLRLHPPAPLLLPRESMEDCQIQGYTIPKKTSVIINAWAIGRDPEVWEAAEEFRPERFNNSLIDFKGNDFRFIPFGAGRRICPGMNFAVATAELALANLVAQFDWNLPPGMGREDLGMAESPRITTHMKQRLHLVAKPCTY